MPSPAPSRTRRFHRPSPSAATAHDSSTISCPWTKRDQGPPCMYGAMVTPIGAYRALRSAAARIAVAADPPDPRTVTAANCALPANVVRLITTGATGPMPVPRARTPKATPKANTAIARGATDRMPSRAVRSEPSEPVGKSARASRRVVRSARRVGLPGVDARDGRGGGEGYREDPDGRCGRDDQQGGADGERDHDRR